MNSSPVSAIFGHFIVWRPKCICVWMSRGFYNFFFKELNITCGVMSLILSEAFLPNQLFIFVQKEGSLGSSVDPIGIFFPWL